ncbi:MAG: ADP-ribosylglycohydrolase family protein [Lachnospiraceae bacterium]|nr:ADP-ribosylglycohydrolase family protein [Lachnospiraceae bacterium]
MSLSGDDSDTVGAIAGGIAALYYGYEGIPEAGWPLETQGMD